MPVNAGYEYLNAEKKYLEATNLDEQIVCLEEMIRTAPKHKSSENLLAGLKTRLKKFLEKKEKNKKTGKSSRKSIKKEGYQCVIIGLPNSGKSSLLSALTNAKPLISPIAFTTREPEIGTLEYQGVKTQIVDLPAIGAETLDIGIVNTADLIIITITDFLEIQKILPLLSKSYGKQLTVFAKSDILSEEQKRKVEATITSKKIKGILVSSATGYNLDTLKEKIISEMNVIRVYTKEPGKIHSKIPVILPSGSTIKDVAESILKGFSQRVKETRITGPSSKFANQKVGLSHILRDKDIVEFHTK